MTSRMYPRAPYHSLAFAVRVLPKSSRAANVHEVQSPGGQECPRLLKRTRLSPPALRPGQDESFLHPTRAISSRGEKGDRKGENVFRHPPPRSRPLCLKTKFTTDAAGSLFGASRCDFKARPTSARDTLPKFGTWSSRLLALCLVRYLPEGLLRYSLYLITTAARLCSVRVSASNGFPQPPGFPWELDTASSVKFQGYSVTLH